MWREGCEGLSTSQTEMTADDVRGVLRGLDAYEPIDFEAFGVDDLILAVLGYVDNFHGFNVFESLEDSHIEEDAPLLFHQAVDALQYAAYWIYSKCDAKDCLSGSEKVSKAAMKVLDEAENYFHTRDSLVSCLGGWASAIQVNSNELNIVASPKLSSGIDVANRKIARAETAKRVGKSTTSEDPFDLLEMKASRKRSGKIELPSKEFNAARSELESVMTAKSQFPGGWDLGGYTFADLRRFWCTLVAMMMIDRRLASRWKQKIGGVIVQPRSAWIAEIARRGALDKVIVERILSDLIYSKSLYRPLAQGEKRKIPYVGAQPFFPLANGGLALSLTMTLLIDIEFAVFDLISVIRERLYSDLSRTKETEWLAELRPWLEQKGLSCYGSFNVEFKGEKTNLDLMIVDHKDKLALCCELKWLKPLDSLRDAVANDKGLLEGCEQAQLCLDWLRDDLNRLKQRVPSVNWDEYEIEAMVISRNALGGSRIHGHSVPIINLAVLEAVLGEPHHKKLRDLYRVAKHKSYEAKEGIHFTKVDIDSVYGGWTIKAKNMGMLSTGIPWSLRRDITFP